MRIDRLKRGVLYAFVAGFFYALMAFIVKVQGEDVPNQMIVFFRQLFSLLILMTIILFMPEPHNALRTGNVRMHIYRTVAGIIGMSCLFYAIKHLPLTDAVLLSQTRPLFVPFIVLFWSGKKWPKYTFLGLFLGFLGIAEILKPSIDTFELPALVGLGAGLFSAIAASCSRNLTKTDKPNAIFFFFLIFSIPIAFFPMLYNWTTPTPSTWIFLIEVAAVATCYQLCLMRAFQSAKAHIVTAILYVAVPLSLLSDYLIGDLELDFLSVLGIISVGLGIYIIIQPHKVGQARSWIADLLKSSD